VIANGSFRLDRNEWIRAVEKRRAALGGIAPMRALSAASIARARRYACATTSRTSTAAIVEKGGVGACFAIPAAPSAASALSKRSTDSP
jgi:hypothetical protein